MCVCLYIRINKYTSNVNTLVEEGTWKDRLFIINGEQFDTWPSDVNLYKFVDEIGRIVKKVEKLYISRSRKLNQYIIVKWNGEEAATWPSTGPIKFWFQEQIESLYHMWNLGLPIQLPLPFFSPFKFVCCTWHPMCSKILAFGFRTLKYTRCFMYPRIFGFENLPLYVSVCVYICSFSSADVSKWVYLISSNMTKQTYQ